MTTDSKGFWRLGDEKSFSAFTAFSCRVSSFLFYNMLLSFPLCMKINTTFKNWWNWVTSSEGREALFSIVMTWRLQNRKGSKPSSTFNLRKQSCRLCLKDGPFFNLEELRLKQGCKMGCLCTCLQHQNQHSCTADLTALLFPKEKLHRRKEIDQGNALLYFISCAEKVRWSLFFSKRSLAPIEWQQGDWLTYCMR